MSEISSEVEGHTKATWSWTEWVAIVGSIGTVVGIVLSVFFYTKSMEKRRPVLVFDQVRTEIINSSRSSSAPIRVLRNDSSEVDSDITSVRLYFWNAGRSPIRAEHVLRPIQITVSGIDNRIMDFRVLSVSREVVGLRIKRPQGEVGRTIELEFAILEHNDGGTIQIILEGDSSAEFSISGIIEGAREILSENPRFRLDGDWVILIGMLLVALILFGGSRYWILHYPPPEPIWKEVKKEMEALAGDETVGFITREDFLEAVEESFREVEAIKNTKPPGLLAILDIRKMDSRFLKSVGIEGIYYVSQLMILMVILISVLFLIFPEFIATTTDARATLPTDILPK